LPGLIEGAAQGVGLGHEFLRHVERTRVLIHLVEPFPSDGSDPVKNYHAIRKELREYSEYLSEKPEVVCVSKAELTGADDVAKQMADEPGHEVPLISAVTGPGLAKLVGQVAQLLAEIKREEAEAEARKKPVEFPTESAVRTDDFKTGAVASITPSAAADEAGRGGGSREHPDEVGPLRAGRRDQRARSPPAQPAVGLAAPLQGVGRVGTAVGRGRVER